MKIQPNCKTHLPCLPSKIVPAPNTQNAGAQRLLAVGFLRQPDLPLASTDGFGRTHPAVVGLTVLSHETAKGVFMAAKKKAAKNQAKKKAAKHAPKKKAAKKAAKKSSKGGFGGFTSFA